ncbi:MAG: 50S ribosomal protein L10 [Saprospiraceae bacterium]|nr:50S ribosomal protein L10 [Saprospiraceae bacterium]
MTKQEKVATIEELQNKFAEHEFFYVTDSSTLSVEEVNKLRRLCFENGIEMRVVKNTLARKALEAAADEKGYEPLYDILKGPTAIMFTETSNAPAKTIKQFREDYDRPLLKAAYIDTDVYIGDDQLETLVKLKSKEELIGEVIGLLQSPMKNLISALQSGGNTLSGLLKALEERTEAPAASAAETPVESTDAAEATEETETPAAEAEQTETPAEAEAAPEETEEGEEDAAGEDAATEEGDGDENA